VQKKTIGTNFHTRKRRNDGKKKKKNLPRKNRIRLATRGKTTTPRKRGRKKRRQFGTEGSPSFLVIKRKGKYQRTSGTEKGETHGQQRKKWFPRAGKSPVTTPRFAVQEEKRGLREGKTMMTSTNAKRWSRRLPTKGG